MRNKIKLLDYQQEVKESKAKQVICRWGRRTGKDVLINELAGKKDLVIYPTYQMARVIYRDYNKGSLNLKTKKGAPLVSADRPTLLKARKIFLVEPAFFHDLLPLLEELKKDNFDQVYFIGTPHLVSNDLASSGFLFDAICARARMGRLKDIFYSEHSFMDNSYIPSDFGKNLKEQLPTNVFNEEMEAQYLENI